MAPSHSPKQNRILVALPPADYARLLPHLELVCVPVGEGIYSTRYPHRPSVFFSDRLRYRSLKWVAKWPGYPDFSNGKRRNGRISCIWVTSACVCGGAKSEAMPIASTFHC